MAHQIIPLAATPNQRFDCTLKVNGGVSLPFTFFIRYNEIADYWVMSIKDTKTGNYVLSSIPLVPGDYPAGNLLKQYDYLKIGSAYLVKVGDLVDELPTQDNLGTEWFLVWSDNNGDD